MVSVRRTVEKFRARCACWAYRKGLYRFSPEDLRLYLHERYTMRRPASKSLSHDDGQDLLEIGGQRIYWPAELASNALPWLYAEVFAPWQENPSSYGHPAMDLENRAWVVDAGACEGFFSCFALGRGVKRVVAVEPLPTVCHALCKTFATAIDAGQFELIEAALGSVPGTANLCVDPLKACDASVVAGGEGQAVRVATLDELAVQFNLKTDGLIKMDIEGSEMEALRGGVQLLRKYQPRLAIAVYHGYENARLCADIIREANPDYTIEFRGMYGWYNPPRPYLLFAW